MRKVSLGIFLVLSTLLAREVLASETHFTDHEPAGAAAIYNPETGDLTVDVDTTPPRHKKLTISQARRADRSGFVRLDFFRRTDDQQIFSADANPLFSANRIFVGATTQGHFQSPVAHYKAHFVLHLDPKSITRETRLVMVISFTRKGVVKGPAFTTAILTPPTNNAGQ